MVRISPPACAGRSGSLVSDAPGMVPDAMGNSRYAVRISPFPAPAALAHPSGLLSPRAGNVPVQPFEHPGQVCGAHLVHGLHHVYGHPDADLHYRRFCGQCGRPDEPGCTPHGHVPLLPEPAAHDPEPDSALYPSPGNTLGAYQTFLILRNHRHAAVRTVPAPNQHPHHHRRRLCLHLLRHLRVPLGTQLRPVQETDVLLPEPEQK